MYEIFVVLLLLVAAAKKPTRRRRYSLRRVRVSPQETLQSLITKIVLVQPFAGAAPSAYRVMSVIGTWSITNFADVDGPITVGIAHSDYTITEIKESIEAVAGIDPGDKIAQEQAARLVRIVGSFVSGGNDNLNNGQPIKTRLNWLITTGDQLNMFCYNDGITMTTGSVVNFMGDMYVKDAA